MRTIRVALVALCCVSLPAISFAQEGEAPVAERPTAATSAPAEVSEAPAKKKDKDLEVEVNAFFGKWFVGPIANVFFYDLWFWDSETDATVVGEQTLFERVVIAPQVKGDDPTIDWQPSTHAPLADGLHVDLTGVKEGTWTQVKLKDGTVGWLSRKSVAPTNLSIPVLVLWLVFGALFFTFKMALINIRGLRHAFDIVRGKYDNPDDVGEVSHFQALTAALSATVGLGNIAGVAIAISIGGPGATFWMIMAGFLGMASKFTECTLGQKYREIDKDGTVLGGPMMYLSKGLAELNWPRLGKVLAVFFVILCIGGSFAGGNAYQVNQSLGAIEQKVTFLQDNHWLYGLIMSALVGVVIIGGIKRIASMAEAIVPLMCGIYVSACIYILLANAGAVPAAFGSIFSGAFGPDAMFGGLLGVLMVGFKRAAFSNEAGVGSAAIAHSAAKSEYPVQEGLVSLLEPFVDTIVVCTMTALVIVITGAADPVAHPEWAELVNSNNGAGLTSQAMGSEISWFPWILAIAVALFAYSTMISWSYYGERCWTWAFGPKSTLYYRVLFLVFCFLGALMTGTTVLDFGDLMILGMAFPNILGLIMLSGSVKADLDDYWGKLKSGEVKPTS